MRVLERYGHVESRYAPHSRYSEDAYLAYERRDDNEPYNVSLGNGLLEGGNGHDMQPDAATLAKLLVPVELPGYASVADRIFGGQTRRARLSIEHIGNLMRERAQLHKRHIADINHRDRQMQEALFGARLNARLDGYRRVTKLEQALPALDKERRQEELAFWKDTAELRDRLFELGGYYQGLRHRMTLFDDVRAEAPSYG